MTAKNPERCEFEIWDKPEIIFKRLYVHVAGNLELVNAFINQPL